MIYIASDEDNGKTSDNEYIFVIAEMNFDKEVNITGVSTSNEKFLRTIYEVIYKD